MVRTTAALLAEMAASCALAAQRPLRIPPPFERMTMKDGEATGVQGAGCVWSDFTRKRGERTWTLAMADAEAVVKRGGRYIMLKPGKGAKDMGPFTFDLWGGEGLTISVRQTGRGRAAGTAIGWPAVLVVTERGRTTTYAGNLNCGT